MPFIITCKRQSGSQLFSLICLLRNGHVGPKLSTFSPLGPLHYPWVLSVVFKCFANSRITDQIAFLCVHAPRGHIYLRHFGLVFHIFYTLRSVFFLYACSFAYPVVCRVFYSRSLLLTFSFPQQLVPVRRCAHYDR